MIYDSGNKSGDYFSMTATLKTFCFYLLSQRKLNGEPNCFCYLICFVETTTFLELFQGIVMTHLHQSALPLFDDKDRQSAEHRTVIFEAFGDLQ